MVVVGGLAAAMGRGILEGHTVGRTALTGYLLAFLAAACYGGTNVVAKELTNQLTSPLVVSSISLFFWDVVAFARWPAGRQWRGCGNLGLP